MRANPRLFIGVEGIVKRRQVFDDILQFHFDAVDFAAAFEAIPLETVDIAGRRAPSITKPTESATGRWGEWMVWGGSRKTSPSLIVTS